MRKLQLREFNLLKINHVEESLNSFSICGMLSHLIKLCFFFQSLLSAVSCLVLDYTVFWDLCYGSFPSWITFPAHSGLGNTLHPPLTRPWIVSFLFPKPKGIIIIKPFVSLASLNLNQWTFSFVEILSSFFFPQVVWDTHPPPPCWPLVPWRGDYRKH